MEQHTVLSGLVLRCGRRDQPPTSSPNSSNTHTQGNVPEKKKKRINIYSFSFLWNDFSFFSCFAAGVGVLCTCVCVSCWLAAILPEDGGPFPRPGLAGYLINTLPLLYTGPPASSSSSSSAAADS